MAFDLYGFARLSSCANSRIPVLWGYATSDTTALMDSSGYFNEVSDKLEVGDIIMANTDNGSCSITRADGTTPHDNEAECVADDSEHDGSGTAGVWTNTGVMESGFLQVSSNTGGVVDVNNTTVISGTDTD